MKYLLVLFLILSGCAATVTQTNNLYDCAIFGPHGTYATMTVGADSIEDAEKSAAQVKQNLIDKKLVPDYVASECFKEYREYPRGK